MSLNLHQGPPSSRAASSRAHVLWDFHQSQLLMTTAGSSKVSATGPSEIKSWTSWNFQQKSSSLMALLTRPTLPAWNLTPFTVTDPSPTLVTILTPRPLWTDSQQAGKGRGDLNFKDDFFFFFGLKRRGAFRSYLCNAASTSLIISLISMTRLPDGLERRSGSCLN